MAKLSQSMVDDLQKGIAALSLLPYTEKGVTFSNLDFTNADQIFTLKDSFSITPSDPTSEEIKIDQMGLTIDTVVESGEYKMAGQIPSVAVDLLDYFMTKANDVTGIIGQDGKVNYAGASFYASPREVLCTVLVESASKKTAIVFAKVKFVIPGVTVENASTPAYLAFNADILANAMANQGDFAVLKSTATV